MKQSIYGLGMLICLTALPVGLVMAQLPDERVLPGKEPGGQNSNPATPSETAPLPDEKTLPGAANGKPAELPSERILPGARLFNEPRPVASPGAMRPWLRLTYPGHTGIIRALDLDFEGNWMASGGEDKDLHVWMRGDANPAWVHRRTNRWPIERGPLGRIYAIAQRGTVVAMAGQGATGGSGEIWMFDIQSGALLRSLVDDSIGHDQPVVSLAFAPGDPERLVSADMEGRVLLWQADAMTGIWSARSLVEPDSITYGPEVAAALRPLRSFLPVRFLSPTEVVVPYYVGATEPPDVTARWHVGRINLNSGAFDILQPTDHLEMIVAIASTGDGRHLATGDAFGNLFFWIDASRQSNGVLMQTPAATPISLDFDRGGKRLLVGTALSSDDTPRSYLELWDTSDPKTPLLNRVALNEPVMACGFDEAHRSVVAANGNRILVYGLDQASHIVNEPVQTLAPVIQPVRHVAFSKDTQDGYRIGFGSELDAQGRVKIENTFDLNQLRLGRETEVDPASWRDPLAPRGDWSMRGDSQDGEPAAWLYRGEEKGARIPLIPIEHGTPTAIAWHAPPVADPDSRPDPGLKTAPIAVVGSDGRDNIYVFQAAMEGAAKVLRQFRGHTGSVLSVGTSADGRYLVSSSQDATIAIWKLEDVFTASEMTNRWGLELEIENGNLIATNVRDDGPLYFRGIRDGDRLVSIQWKDRLDQDFAAATPETMLAALREVPFDTLVLFQWGRRGQVISFQSYPAWQPVATLYVDAEREWAFWTPAGFYDASFNGHQRFGWQINRPGAQIPEFFRADQFRQRLERPEVMRRLLQRGSLPSAMQQAGIGIGPPPGETALVNQIRSRPQIRVLRPADGQTIEDDELVVEAEITFSSGATLVPPRVFASGVPAHRRELIASTADGGTRTSRYRWHVRLPRGSRIPLEVLAATDATAVDRVAFELRRPTQARGLPPPNAPFRKRGHMHVIAVGTNVYQDPQIPSLEFASRGARTILAELGQRSQALYDFEGCELVDRDAVRPLWREFAAEAVRSLAPRVSPDDLVVLYFCGHGLRDRRTNQWYFVTSDARYNDLMEDRYGDCLAFGDFAALATLPCRKLAILDTCHSGAVQMGMDSTDLKAALRWLQDDVVLTLTASEGEEEALEQSERKLGRFTSRLLEALAGLADTHGGNADGMIDLQETVDYVQRTLRDDAESSGFIQHPTAGPAELIKTIELPLTTTNTNGYGKPAP